MTRAKQSRRGMTAAVITLCITMMAGSAYALRSEHVWGQIKWQRVAANFLGLKSEGSTSGTKTRWETTAAAFWKSESLQNGSASRAPILPPTAPTTPAVDEPVNSPVTPPSPNEEPDPGYEPPPGELLGTGIVYTRQPRARTPVPGTSYEEASTWQHTSDVGRINGGIAESDVVIDDLRGNVEVIHDCTGSNEICVAQEARVSPDGSKIAYSVGYGNKLNEVYANGKPLGIYEIPSLTHAKLFVYDFATQTSTPIPNHSANIIDRQPEWLDNNTIVFASNRAGLYPHKTQFSQHRGRKPNGEQRWFSKAYGTSQPYGYNHAGMAMQIWRMDIDGSRAKNLTPHETMALSPAVMSSGDIVYSCWNGHANEAFDSPNRTTNNPGTEVNKWWVCQMDGNGAQGNTILNGHKTPLLKTTGWLAPDVVGGEGHSRLRALRSVAEIRKDYMVVTNYYRANHTGSMGIIYGMSYSDPGVEGVSQLNNFQLHVFNSDREGSGRYIPSDFIAVTPYGNDQDLDPRRDGRGRLMGKAGYASALPETNDFMITHGRGLCYEQTRPDWANRDWTGGEPLCQKGIYRVKTDMVTDPFNTSQMELIAGGDEWQVWDADAITTFEKLWGQALPTRPKPLSGDACYIQVVDARKAELHSPAPYDWKKNLYEQCSTQGCGINTEDKGFHANNMRYLTVYEVEMWDKTYSNGNQEEFGNTSNNHGFKSLRTWGYQELESDGSIRMEVPCETPIQIVGQDERTMTIAHDDRVHSLRKGETRTCHGCHDGHSEERAAELGASAVEDFADTIAARTDHPAPDNGYRRTWRDVEPIIEKRCSGCHEDMNNNDGLLDSRLAWDYEQTDWPWATRMQSENGKYQMPRPYTSKWVGKLARNSMLYWKCMGSRQDGRTDRQYANDIDFGQSHPQAANILECMIIGQWIDQGIQRGWVQ